MVGGNCELGEGTNDGKFGRNRSTLRGTNFDTFSILWTEDDDDDVVDCRLMNGTIGCDIIVYDFNGKILLRRDHKSSIVYRSHFVAK